jgi:hypothetical protein
MFLLDFTIHQLPSPSAQHPILSLVLWREFAAFRDHSQDVPWRFTRPQIGPAVFNLSENQFR